MKKRKMGKLEVITGCMFSGKTEELIRRLERVRIARGNVLLFKPTLDDRYGRNKVATHFGRELDGILLEPGKESIEELIELAGKVVFTKAAVLAFDEGNFFSKKLPALCEKLVQKMDKRVIVAGLDLTFAGEPFGPMPTLLALADQVDKLQAVCVKCGGIATRTQRLIDGKPAPSSDPVIKVGGLGTYEARCRDCYEKG